MTSPLAAIDAERLTLLEEDARRRATRSFRWFIEYAWSTLEPNQPFVSNWHIDAIAEHLEAVSRGEIQNLLINIPPGCMKSLATSVLWPAWEWARDPSLTYLCASYDQALSLRDNVRCRTLIESEWYRERWPDVQLADDQNAKGRYATTAGGWRFATTIGGRATGEHPRRKIVDDPHDVKRAHSAVERQGALDWFDQTLSSRGAALRAATVVIMQRLHENDLSGHILKGETRDQWVHLCLPMRYEPKRMVETPIGWMDPRTKPGELLWPALFDAELLGVLERKMGSYATAGQMQQRPAPAEGGLIQRRWWKFYRTPPMPALDEIVLSIDTALKEKQLSDYWAGQAWGRRGADAFLVRSVRGRWGLTEGTQQVRDLYRWARETFPGVRLTVLVENAAAGPDVIAALKREIPGILGITPKGEKTQRVFAVTPQLEAGNVWVPGAAQPDGSIDTALTPAWVQDFLAECSAFPTGANDDQVDAMSQALLRLGGGISSAAVIKAGQRHAKSVTKAAALEAVHGRFSPAELGALERDVATFGSETVAKIRRLTDSSFVLPAHLEGIPPGGSS